MAIMKSVILVLACAALGSCSASRDKRSYGHAQYAHGYPVSVHTVVQPSSTLPVIEYPESTEINTHSHTVYSVSVPVTHTVHYEQPSHSRQVYYYTPPAYNYQSYQAPVYHDYQSVYTPTVYDASAYRSHGVYAPSQPWVYQRNSAWC